MVMGLSFHNMTFLILKIRFFILQICYVSFVNWASFFKWLGHPDVRNYDGSWTEWGNLVGAPIER